MKQSLTDLMRRAIFPMLLMCWMLVQSERATPTNSYSWVNVDQFRGQSSYSWTKVTGNAAFAPRDGAGALVFKGKMWIIGGWNPSDSINFPRSCANDVWNSTDGANWTLVKPNTFGTHAFNPDTDWEGRHYAGYVVFKNRMWIIGGDCLQGYYQSDVWNSADGRTWQRVSQTVPWGPRFLQHTLVYKGLIWVFGGQTLPQFAPAEEGFFDDVWNTADGIHWHKVERAGAAWLSRGMMGGAVAGDRIWILGGGTYDTPESPERRFYNDVWSSTDGAHWQCATQSASWEPRQMHDVAVFDGKLWVLEGYDGANRNDVWYSSDGSDWRELPDTPWQPRHAASVFVYNNALWVVAGNNMESDVWKLDSSVPRHSGWGRLRSRLGRR